MFAKTTTIVAILGAASTVVGRSCHVHSKVLYEQTNACGSGSCIPGQTTVGTAKLSINGKQVWKGGSYGSLSNSGGVDVKTHGVKFHIDPLGIPAANNPPHCHVHIGKHDNIGIGDTGSIGLPGVVGQSLSCDHDFHC